MHGKTDRPKNPNFEYDGNGRIILPDQNEISALPKDGGELFNRLIFESSPYLLQHAANPVDWYPWSKEAFLEAKARDVPVFLSVGYSTCHWCHVMEHESFEDEEVAQLMNASFVNIKVDREERPDVDKLYMDVTQMMTGRGGWPMTVIMTAEAEPFFAGTYIPKHARYNRAGIMELIPKITEMWQKQRSDLLADAQKISSRIANNYRGNNTTESVHDDVLKKAFDRFESTYDENYGGFGDAPKFPKAHDYMFLLRYWNRTGNSKALAMVEKSLEEMRKGGMYDQLGFGFHRYSTDAKWLAPHFEKMLYDQAILIMAYTEAWQATGKEKYRQVVDEIITYIDRDMTSAKGGFYSAEDADSEGEEGTFYLWNTDEIKSILGEDDGKKFIDLFNLETGGNWPEGKRHGNTNILHLQTSYPVSEPKMENWRLTLFDTREKRVHPLKDDKILTDWNGLMIAALAHAGKVLNQKKYIVMAEKCAVFILTNLIKPNGELKKRYRKGQSGLKAVLDDYAFTIWGLIELYQATFKLTYLEEAINLSNYQMEHFWDDEGDGFYFSADDGEKLLARVKEYYDGAVPSGNSVSAYNFIRLGRLLSRSDFEEIAQKTINSNAVQVNRIPSGFSVMMMAVDFALSSFEVLIFEGKNSENKRNSLPPINRHYQPNKVVVFNDDTDSLKLNSLMPYLSRYPQNDHDEDFVYVCENYACKLPTTDLKKVIELLGGMK